jgi:hypothetical protein
MKKCFLLLALPALLYCCGEKKKAASGAGELADVHEFFDFFKDVKLPINFSDTTLTRRGKDSVSISLRAFLQFVPDSVLFNFFAKGTKPRIYPLGRVVVKGSETYLFAKAIAGTKRMALVLCFNKSNKFLTSKPLVVLDADQSATSWQAGMDPKMTITTIRQHKTSDGQQFFKREVYEYSEDVGLIMILTESNETNPKALQIINPIETFGRKHKFAGDYVLDKRNFVSVRDAKNPARIMFFVHFENENEDCKGELKGEAKFTTPTTALYKGSTDPCSVLLSFSPNLVRIKEIEGCGNHRDIKCFFDGAYPKAKEMRTKSKKKKAS